MNKAIVSWSGGKDSCYAAMIALAQGIKPVVLLNVLNEEGKISRSHGIPAYILKAQAERAALPLKLISSSWPDYEKKFTEALIECKKEHGVAQAVFGDIDLEAHKEWEEKVCAHAGLQASLPLWQKDRKELVLQMLKGGIKTMIVSCNAQMGADFLGKELNPQLVSELEKMGVDPCGENGEFHTLVTHCPLFKTPIEIGLTNKLLHDQYWFSQLVLLK